MSVVPRAILIVEDDQDVSAALRDVLTHEGYPVVVARNGREALEAIARGGPPGLVLLDLMMPVMDGWEFLELLDPEVTVVVVSAHIHGAKTMAAATLVRRPDGFMSKPVNVDIVLELARRYCAEPTHGASPAR